MPIEKVGSVVDFLTLVKSLKKNFERFIFRGQPDASWKVTSGAHRRLSASKAIAGNESVDSDEMRDYLVEKIAEVRRRVGSHRPTDARELSDVNLLVEMQHYGAATNLIDFTFNCLNALYFACLEYMDKDGKVFCISNNNPNQVLLPQRNSLTGLFPTPAGKFYSFTPDHSNSRVIKQDSIFILNDVGFIDDQMIDHVILISGEKKIQILKDLEEFVGISEETIYPDFLGYLQANNARKPIKTKTAQDFFDQGVDFHKRRVFDRAIDCYEKSLRMQANQPRVFWAMALSFRFLEDFDKALECIEASLKHGEGDYHVYSELGVINTYKKNEEGARKAFEKAILFTVKDPLKQRNIQNNIGWSQLVFGRISAAIKTLRPLVKSGNVFHPAINLAHCFLLKKKVEDAIAMYCISRLNATTKDEFKRSFDSDFRTIEALCAINIEKKNEIYALIEEKCEKQVAPSLN